MADTLSVADFDAEWLSTMAADKKLSIPHVSLDGAVLLTATTEELQKFVRTYAHTPRSLLGTRFASAARYEPPGVRCHFAASLEEREKKGAAGSNLFIFRGGRNQPHLVFPLHEVNGDSEVRAGESNRCLPRKEGQSQ